MNDPNDSVSAVAEDISLDDFLPYLVNRISNRLNIDLSEDLRTIGLSLPHWRVLAVLNVGDHFNARRVFFVSALLGAGCNAAFALLSQGLAAACLWRFLTGVTLAGVYPVGMKIVASWFRSGLGWRLGVMVGALTAGTASPYLLRAVGADLPWRMLALAASGSAVAGGILLLAGVRDGPFLQDPDLGSLFNMTGLTATSVERGKIVFEGTSATDFATPKITVVLIPTASAMHLAGTIESPCCDFFDYTLDALARKMPPPVSSACPSPSAE